MYPSKKLPSIGQMRSKLYLISNTQADDGYGGQTDPVQLIDRTMWVYARLRGSGEISEAGSTVKQEEWVFTGRYAENEPEAGQTFSFNGKELRLHSYEIFDQKNKFIEIVAVTTGNTTSILSDDGGGGAEGEMPGGRFDANYGTPTEALPFFIQYDLFDLVTGTIVEILNSGVCVIDWGDGNGIQSYATSPTIIQKTYAEGEYTDRQATVKVYHNNDIGIHILSAVSGTAFCKCNTVGGTIPSSLTKFTATSLLLQTAPSLPVGCKEITLISNSIDQAGMETFVSQLVANGQTDGILRINNQIPALDYSTMSADLTLLRDTRGWSIFPDP